MEIKPLSELTFEILNNGYLMSLGTVDEGGVWVADVIYTFDDDLNLYWMSTPERRHSKAIEADSHVAGTISLNMGPEDPDAGLQFSGRAQRVESLPWESVLRYFRKRHKPEPKTTDDILGEHVWYQLTPDRLELIYARLFGYEKQRVR